MKNGHIFQFPVVKDPVADFHKHLDKCAQCREHPFSLCPVGHAVLVAATGVNFEYMTADKGKREP